MTSEHHPINVFSLLYLRGEEAEYQRFLSTVGLPREQWEGKTAACIESSLRVKYCAARCRWHHLTLPRRGALASFSGLASSRMKVGPQRLHLVSPGDLPGQKLLRNIATKILNLCLYWLGRKFFSPFMKTQCSQKATMWMWVSSFL